MLFSLYENTIYVFGMVNEIFINCDLNKQQKSIADFLVSMFLNKCAVTMCTITFHQSYETS